MPENTRYFRVYFYLRFAKYRCYEFTTTGDGRTKSSNAS